MSEKKDQLKEILKDQLNREAKQIEEEVGLNDNEEIPDELKLRQLAECRCDALLANAKLLCQRLSRKDHEHLTGIIHPAVAP